MFFYVQEGLNFNSIYDFILKNNEPTYIISDTEWVVGDLHNQLLNKVPNYKDLNLLLGSFDCDYYKREFPSVNTIHWPTFWFNWASLLLGNEVDYTNAKYENFTNPFICLNNKSNILRCAIIDNLAKFNILNKGIVTWNKFRDCKEGYVLKYYDDSFRSVDDDFFVKQDSFIICKEYYNSLFHIVGESTNHVPFITEKTVNPILFKKPFVVLGCKGFNKKLTDLGFEPYDEIVDYSFDSYDDVETRGSILINSLTHLTTEKDLNGLYKKLYPKILHNYNRALEIIKDINYIPMFVQQCVLNWESQKIQLNPVQSRWQYFINSTNIKK